MYIKQPTHLPESTSTKHWSYIPNSELDTAITTFGFI